MRQSQFFRAERVQTDPDIISDPRSHGSAASAPTARRPRRTGLRRLIFWTKFCAISVCTAAIITAIVFASYAIRYPDPFAKRFGKRTPTIQIVARDGTLIAERGRPHDYIPIDLLPKHVSQAIIATEDRRFFQHWGVDPLGMVRAAFANLRAGRTVQGGSTLTQQLAKNLFLSNKRSLARKIEELFLAFWLEVRLTKRDILELYLNQVYFGSGAYGIEAASQRYFGKSANRLTLAEAALIAGLLKAPSRFSPHQSLRRAQRRAQSVLGKMVAADMIDPATASAAASQPYRIAPLRKDRVDPAFGHALEMILERLPTFSGLDHGLIIVETTLDARVQRTATRALSDHLTATGTNGHTLQGAITLLDPDGGIRTLVGGRTYHPHAYNRATTARRQPGSAFKPFVFLAALQMGRQPDSIVYDLPVTIGDWRPRNAAGRHYGAITMRDGLARSLNTIAVRLLQDVGVARVKALAQTLGIESPLANDATLALGTSEVGLMELTAAYAVFANGGFPVKPHIINRVRTSEGRVLFARSSSISRRSVDHRHVAQINEMLAAALTRGTGRRAVFSDQHSLAGKTGTSQNGRDGWFIGYSRHLVGGVWIGTDDGETRHPVSGGKMPATLWRVIMQEAHRGLPAGPLPGQDDNSRTRRPFDPPKPAAAQLASARTPNADPQALPPLPSKRLAAPPRAVHPTVRRAKPRDPRGVIPFAFVAHHAGLRDLPAQLPWTPPQQPGQPRKRDPAPPAVWPAFVGRTDFGQGRMSLGAYVQPQATAREP